MLAASERAVSFLCLSLFAPMICTMAPLPVNYMCEVLGSEPLASAILRDSSSGAFLVSTATRIPLTLFGNHRPWTLLPEVSRGR